MLFNYRRKNFYRSKTLAFFGLFFGRGYNQIDETAKFSDRFFGDRGGRWSGIKSTSRRLPVEMVLVHNAVGFVWDDIYCSINAFHATDVAGYSLLSCMECGSKFCYDSAGILPPISFNIFSYCSSDYLIAHILCSPF